MNKNKKRNKRFARKRGLNLKHGIEETQAKRDSLRASKRKWDKGAGK